MPRGEALSPAVHILIVAIFPQAQIALKPESAHGTHALCVHGRLGGQLLTATQATSLQHVTAAAGRHTGAEAVDLGALALLGLIRTEHGKTPLLANSNYSNRPHLPKKAQTDIPKHTISV